MFLIYFYNERPIFFHCLTLNGIHSKLVYRIKVFLVHKMSEETQILYTLVVRKDVYPEPTMTRRVKWTLSRFSSVWTEPWCYLGFGALVNSRSNTSCMELNWGCLSLSRGWLSSVCATVKKVRAAWFVKKRIVFLTYVDIEKSISPLPGTFSSCFYHCSQNLLTVLIMSLQLIVVLNTVLTLVFLRAKIPYWYSSLA